MKQRGITGGTLIDGTLFWNTKREGTGKDLLVGEEREERVNPGQKYGGRLERKDHNLGFVRQFRIKADEVKHLEKKL